MTPLQTIPSDIHQVFMIWKRNFIVFKKSWMTNFFWILLEPLFYLLAVGYGLGFYVNSVDGMSYVEFFFPALIATSSMMVAFFESTYSAFSKLTYQKTYETLLLAPIGPQQLVLGETLWGATKGTLSSLSVILVSSLFLNFQVGFVLLGLPFIFLSSFFFASLGMLVTSMVRNYDQIIYPTSGLIIPMSLFCGTYFPLSQLPWVIEKLCYLLPLTHAVSALRMLTTGKISWALLIFHFIVLAFLSLLVFRISWIRLQKKLIR